MTRSTMAAALALGLAACSPSVHATAFRPAPQKVSADQVDVFTDSRPTRVYEELVQVG